MYETSNEEYNEEERPNGGAQEPAIAVPNDGRRRLTLCPRCRYLIAEMIARVTISTAEMNVAALISTVIFTIGAHPFRGQGLPWLPKSG